MINIPGFLDPIPQMHFAETESLKKVIAAAVFLDGGFAALAHVMPHL